MVRVALRPVVACIRGGKDIPCCDDSRPMRALFVATASLLRPLGRSAVRLPSLVTGRRPAPVPIDGRRLAMGGLSAAMASTSPIVHIPAASLYVSTPDPSMFGNAANPRPPPTHWTAPNWLRSIFHFSFAEYYEPSKSSFGVLRVLNDDTVQGGRGFGRHPHRDMEILTYVVSGGLRHADSTGNAETLPRGAIQYMSAGRGIMHSEANGAADEPLRFLQLWITPRVRGLTPAYGSRRVAASERADRWVHLAADADVAECAPGVGIAPRCDGSATAARLHQDANIYATELSPGTSIELTVHPQRQVYLVQVEGAATVAGESTTVRLSAHDAATLKVPGTFVISVADGEEKAHLLAVEMARA